MKILADIPISPRTVEFLKKLNIECYHLTEFKMARATDEEIVRFAKEKGFTILTEVQSLLILKNLNRVLSSSGSVTLTPTRLMRYLPGQ